MSLWVRQKKKNILQLGAQYHISRLKFQSKGIKFVMLAGLAVFLFMTWVMPAFCTASESSGIKVYFNGDFQGSSAYIDPGTGTGMAPLALLSVPGLRFDVQDNQAWFSFNGKQVNTTVGSDTYTLDGQNKNWPGGLQHWQYGLAVPVCALFEALGADVSWSEKEKAIYITAPTVTPAIPKNLSQTGLPLQMAFIKDGQLWLLDAGQPEAQPILVPGHNVEQIVGWSYDGEWLAYLQEEDNDSPFGNEILWVVASDGQHPQRLDSLPVAYHTPVWSPNSNTLAYQVQQNQQTDFDQRSLRIVSSENGQWQGQELLTSAGRIMGLGMTWFPDGQSLAVSLIHDAENLPAIDRVDLQGNSDCLFVLPEASAGNYEDGMYIRDMDGLQFSPDGRYLACFLGMNSGSMNADGMNLQIIDVEQPASSLDIGVALGYPEWVQWSPDGQKLAAILGGGREASTGKQLALVQIGADGFAVQELEQTGQVDSRPMWSPNSELLYFARGPENTAWLEEGRHQEVQVPEQQIFCLKDGQTQSLSRPAGGQGDYLLSVSPDGQYLVLQRLTYFDEGDIYLLNLSDGQMVKLMENVQTNPGYYGNYYPNAISLYWPK